MFNFASSRVQRRSFIDLIDRLNANSIIPLRFIPSKSYCQKYGHLVFIDFYFIGFLIELVVLKANFPLCHCEWVGLNKRPIFPHNTSNSRIVRFLGQWNSAEFRWEQTLIKLLVKLCSRLKVGMPDLLLHSSSWTLRLRVISELQGTSAPFRPNCYIIGTDAKNKLCYYRIFTFKTLLQHDFTLYISLQIFKLNNNKSLLY